MLSAGSIFFRWSDSSLEKSALNRRFIGFPVVYDVFNCFCYVVLMTPSIGSKMYPLSMRLLSVSSICVSL